MSGWIRSKEGVPRLAPTGFGFRKKGLLRTGAWGKRLMQKNLEIEPIDNWARARVI